MAETTPTTGYAPVDGLQMYYEIHGEGAPLVLLHGGLSEITSSFSKILPAFAKTRQVIAMEQQGHGHTADIDRPLSFEQMAEDTVALLRQLGIDRADFFGYSMGGGIAFQIASQYPDLVRKLVFAGGVTYSPDGFYPELLAGEGQMKPEDFEGTPWLEAYRRVAPNPKNWPVLLAKSTEMDLKWKGWPREAVQSIQVPTMLIIGDSDICRPEHVVELFRLLGGGVPGDIVGLPDSRLAVLPGTTHVTLLDRVDWLFSMVTDFLDAPMAGEARLDAAA